MNKRDAKNILVGILIGGVVFSGIALATTTIENVFINSFPIILNGENYTSKLPLLNYQNSTYVPLRELATLTGSKVDFKNDTIIIGEHQTIKTFINELVEIQKFSDGYLSNAETQLDMNTYSLQIYEKYDNLLNKIYQYLKATLSAKKFEKLKQDEINWIVEKENAIKESSKEYEDASMRPLMENTTGIEYTRERCHYLLSMACDFIVTYENEEQLLESEEGSIHNTRNLPIITSEKYAESAKKVQEYLKNISDEFWNNHKEDSIEQFNEGYLLNDNIGVSYNFYVRHLTDKYISFVLVMDGGMGGVSWRGIEGYNFDIETGEILKFSDICDLNDNTKNIIYTKLIEDIEKNYPTDEFWQDDTTYRKNWKGTVKDEMFNESNWELTPTGVSFHFEKYSLAYGAMGVVGTELSYNDINYLLKSEFKG